MEVENASKKMGETKREALYITLIIRIEKERLRRRRRRRRYNYKREEQGSSAEKRIKGKEPR